MKRIFMDTNIVIDFLANRLPFYLDAAAIFNFAVEGKVKIYISALSFSNIYYVLRKSLTRDAALELLDGLAEISFIVDTTDSIIRQSLNSDFADFEDAIQYACALSIPEIDFIVTRDTRDFKKSTLSVFNPTEAISLLNILL